MFDTTKPRVPLGTASAFVVSSDIRGVPPDIWAEAGHSIELAYCEPAPMGPVVRAAVSIAVIAAAKLYAAVALVVAAKLCAVGLQ
jgi:hypothetical protein